MPNTPRHLLTDLLEATSRSFYRTLRVLPGTIRPQIGLAYLLARTTDTIADTEIVPVEERLGALNALRERILGRNRKPLEFGELARRQGADAERILLERCEEALAMLEGFNSADQQRIQEVLGTIMSGQELDLKRFAGASAEKITALETDAELDDYTYRGAGCVGEFWTKMCRAHVFPGAALDEKTLLANGVRVGKGLQLVYILRDLPRDLRQGMRYVAATALSGVGVAPAKYSGNFSYIPTPKWLAIICLVSLGAGSFSVHAQRTDSDMQALAREQMRKAMSDLEAQSPATPMNATPAPEKPKPAKKVKAVVPPPAPPT